MEQSQLNNDPAGAQSRGAEGGTNLSVGLGVWISVDDALPKPKTPCLTYTTERRCEIRKMNAHKFSEFFGNKVTHWMPLPEAPNV